MAVTVESPRGVRAEIRVECSHEGLQGGDSGGDQSPVQFNIATDESRDSMQQRVARFDSVAEIVDLQNCSSDDRQPECEDGDHGQFFLDVGVEIPDYPDGNGKDEYFDEHVKGRHDAPR